MEVGTQAPEFALEAVVSERPVNSEALAGRRVVLVFHGPRTSDAPKEVGKAVRAAHPDAGDVFVANVVNLKSMAGMWQKVAKAQLKATYDRMAGKLEAKGTDPVDYVVMCADWDNDVAPRFGCDDSNQAPAVAVLDADGTVLGTATGDDLPGQVLALLA